MASQTFSASTLAFWLLLTLRWKTTVFLSTNYCRITTQLPEFFHRDGRRSSAASHKWMTKDARKETIDPGATKRNEEIQQSRWSGAEEVVRAAWLMTSACATATFCHCLEVCLATSGTMLLGSKIWVCTRRGIFFRFQEKAVWSVTQGVRQVAQKLVCGS